MLKNWNDVKSGDILTVHPTYAKRGHKLRVVEVHPFGSNDDYAIVTGERLRMDGKRSSVPSGARKALPKGQRREYLGLSDVTAVEPAAPNTEAIGDWTIAYRTPRANAFKRVTNWAGTWHQAFELAGIFAKANPDLQVYYVPSADYERREFVGLNKRVDAGQVTREYAVSMIEDHGNVLVEETNRRVKIHETGVLSAEMLALVPDAAEAKARFERDAI